MSEIEEKNSFRERIDMLTNKIKSNNFKNLITFKKLKFSKDKIIQFNNFSELKLKVLGKHLTNSQKSLKQKRLNEIFNMDKNIKSRNFIRKYDEVFKETFDNDKKSKDYYYLTDKIDNRSYSLSSYVNKVKKIYNIKSMNNNFNDQKISLRLLTNKNYKNNILDYYNNFFQNYRSCTNKNVISLRKDILKKSISPKIRLSNINDTLNHFKIISNNNF